MGKHEVPAFRMIIEGGRLVPATPYDAERLDTYRRGTKVSVRFTEEKDRVLVRKWWAIIGKAVKECPTPWKTRDEASEAIKLALGIVNLTKTVGGEWLQYPKSLTELTDPELVDAVEQMVEIIHRVTGVDPDTWKKEIAHVGEDEPSDEVPPSDAGSGATAPHSGPAADQTAGDGEAEEGAEEAAHGEQVAPSSELSADDRAWLLKAAKMLVPCAIPGGDADVVRNQYAGLIKHETPAGISQLAIAKAVSICKRLVAVCEQTEELDKDLIAGIAGVEPREIA